MGWVLMSLRERRRIVDMLRAKVPSMRSQPPSADLTPCATSSLPEVPGCD